MPITADYHVHSYFSGDSDAPMEQMVQSAIAKGLKHICFTEHMDLDFPYDGTRDEPGKWEVNADSYLYELLKMRDKYSDRIEIHFGVEIGLQPQCVRQNLIFAREHEYDFIIASSHIWRYTVTVIHFIELYI